MKFDQFGVLAKSEEELRLSNFATLMNGWSEATGYIVGYTGKGGGAILADNEIPTSCALPAIMKNATAEVSNIFLSVFINLILMFLFFKAEIGWIISEIVTSGFCF